MVAISEKTTFTLGVVILLIAGGVQWGEVRAARQASAGLATDVKTFSLAVAELKASVGGLDASVKDLRAEMRESSTASHRIDLRVNTLEGRVLALESRVSALEGKTQ